jgi:hypothetical protein
VRSARAQQLTRAEHAAQSTGRRCREALEAVINATPAGCPEHRLYAPLAEHLTREHFAQLMRALVAAKRVTRRGKRYLPASAP